MPQTIVSELKNRDVACCAHDLSVTIPVLVVTLVTGVVVRLAAGVMPAAARIWESVGIDDTKEA